MPCRGVGKHEAYFGVITSGEIIIKTRQQAASQRRWCSLVGWFHNATPGPMVTTLSHEEFGIFPTKKKVWMGLPSVSWLLESKSPFWRMDVSKTSVSIRVPMPIPIPIELAWMYWKSEAFLQTSDLLSLSSNQNHGIYSLLSTGMVTVVLENDYNKINYVVWLTANIKTIILDDFVLL